MTQGRVQWAKYILHVGIITIGSLKMTQDISSNNSETKQFHHCEKKVGPQLLHNHTCLSFISL